MVGSSQTQEADLPSRIVCPQEHVIGTTFPDITTPLGSHLRRPAPAWLRAVKSFMRGFGNVLDVGGSRNKQTLRMWRDRSDIEALRQDYLAIAVDWRRSTDRLTQASEFAAVKADAESFERLASLIAKEVATMQVEPRVADRSVERLGDAQHTALVRALQTVEAVLAATTLPTEPPPRSNQHNPAESPATRGDT
jgi:hypothetical protein